MAGLSTYLSTGNDSRGPSSIMKFTAGTAANGFLGWSHLNVSPVTYPYSTMAYQAPGNVVWQDQGGTSDTMNEQPSYGFGSFALGVDPGLPQRTGLTGIFNAGNWTINLGMRANVANATGSARYRLSFWRGPYGEYTYTRIGTYVATTSSWSNLTTSATQTCTATITLPELTLDNELIFVRVVQELLTASSSGTAEALIRLGSETSIITPEFKSFSLRGSTNTGNALLTSADLDLQLASGSLGPLSSGTSAILNYRPAPVYLADRTDVKTNYYAMRGKDNTGYKTWVATGSPDINGSQYTGVVNGTLTDIVVIQAWTN